MTPTTDNPRAALLFTGAVAAFTVNDAIVKGLAGLLAVPQILLLRGLVLSAAYLVLFRARGEPVTAAGLRHPVNLLRGGIEALISLCFFTGLQLLPLATSLALFFTTPVFGTALGALVLGERVGPRRWTAVLVGLLGVVVFLGVDHRGWSWPVVFPLVTAVLVAVRDAVTRRMPVAVPSSTVATTTAIATALVGLATLPLGWLPLSGPLLLVLLVSSAVSGVAFYLYILATRLGELSYLAPFRFLGLPLGAVIGLVAWGDWPGVREWLGAALITGSGLFILRRERTLARSGR